MTNPLWSWLARTRISAYRANQHFQGPTPFEAGPGWCCDRYGQSETVLPDGRTIFVAGEHEDYYDPDFYIYNDVIVRNPDGTFEVFGYPEAEFPPTDFHTATLVGDHIVIVGNLGYSDHRLPGKTPVFSLDCRTLRLDPIATSGQSPGWISKHNAEVQDGCLIVRGGEVFADSLIENIDDYSLNLASRAWTRLTERRWTRVEVSRCDAGSLHLWLYGSALFDLRFREQRHNIIESLPEELRANFLEIKFPSLEEQIGCKPDFEAYQTRFTPPVAHVVVDGEEDEFRVTRIRVGDVVVRYVDEHSSVAIMIEGRLPDAVVNALASDLEQKLSRIENSPCERSIRQYD